MMKNTIYLKSLVAGLILLVLVGCQQLKPADISLPDYPDLEALHKQQYTALGFRSLQKQIALDQETESQTFEMDSAKWKAELSFLLEINPKKPEYVGVFELTEEQNEIQLELLEGEKSVLQSMAIVYENGAMESIKATIHENKDVYVHHRDIEVKLAQGLIKQWTITGYQQMMFRDSVFFSIEGKIHEVP